MTKQAIKLGFVRPVDDIHEYLQWLRVAEEVADPDLIGVGDGQDLWIDPYITMTAIAMTTKRALVGTTVTNPLTRHPAVTAGAIAGLQQLSKGRAFLGIATGLSALRNIGLKPATVQELEDYVRAVQGLTAGETVTWKGQKLKLNWKTQRVPVWVLGAGPKVLAMAGRVADGVILGGGVAQPELVKKMLGYIEAGVKQAGRRMSDLEIWWMVRVAVAPTVEEGIDLMRDYIAGNTLQSYKSPEVLADVPKDIQEKIKILEREYRWDEHVKFNRGPDGMTNNERLLERLGIKHFLANRFMVAGPPDVCVKRFQSLMDAGARNFLIPQVIPGRIETTRTLGEKVFPALRAAAAARLAGHSRSP
ncbi:MAG: LLM class flavin-dependent oxidoreductase [Dehalococcoidia bacterium]|nr:LLM class flavin-dependent oxidoreductase [Dehalococcoidia bacterium]